MRTFIICAFLLTAQAGDTNVLNGLQLKADERLWTNYFYEIRATFPGKVVHYRTVVVDTVKDGIVVDQKTVWKSDRSLIPEGERKTIVNSVIGTRVK